MAIDKSLLSGSNSMLLMKLLDEKDMYGYEMIETLRERSMNVFELKAGTLYPILHKLEEQEYVSTYEEEVGGKIRKYYCLTKSGKKQPGKNKRVGRIFTGSSSGAWGCLLWIRKNIWKR